ncbi:hypothetical protein MOE96_00320 [Bacillus inaquosorum]|uniref:hypothetical protein n=1 Tax=Bacillus inaquosorum TaxID=483913 RepID=UPI00227F603C|nr:hypothetical protein [Bacillus inaquosorum]MCY9093390.1 hypothetical protein [Bacillus inaquosorum]
MRNDFRKGYLNEKIQINGSWRTIDGGNWRMNVYYRKTVVGWWNIYPAGSNDLFVNLSPEEFFTLFLKYPEKHLLVAQKLSPSQRKNYSVRRCGRHDEKI